MTPRKALLFVLLVILVWLLAVFVLRQAKPKPVLKHVRVITVLDDVPAGVEARVTSEHPVIEGGIHSIADLEVAVSRFPNLYRDFDVASARHARLSIPGCAFTSYRIGDTIKWTKNGVCLGAGTEVWVDRYGHMIDARCGNLLSFTDPQPESVPNSANLSAPPVDSPDVPPQIPVLAIPDSDSPGVPSSGTPSNLSPFPPVYPPIGGCCEVPSGRPVQTPEPASFWLLVSGLVLVGLLGWKKKVYRGPSGE